MTTQTRLPGGARRAEISAIPLPSCVAPRDSAPPPGSGVPLRRGAVPRPTRPDPTGARDFTPLGRRFLPCALTCRAVPNGRKWHIDHINKAPDSEVALRGPSSGSRPNCGTARCAAPRTSRGSGGI